MGNRKQPTPVDRTQRKPAPPPAPPAKKPMKVDVSVGSISCSVFSTMAVNCPLCGVRVTPKNSHHCELLGDR